MSASTAIVEARAALDRRQDAIAIDRLLEVWRTTRDATLGDAIDSIAAQLGWLGGATPLDRQLGELATGSAKQIATRVVALSALPADPRIASALVRLVDRPPVTSAVAGPLFTKVFGAMALHNDPRTIARLRSLDDIHRGDIGHRIRARTPAIADAMEHALAPHAPLAAADRAAVEALIAHLASLERPKLVRSRDSLLAEIYLDPEADGPRIVYGDLLAEQGDPHGELIGLQMLAMRTPAQDKRVRALVKAHGKTWLGPLGKAVLLKDLVFERGFPAVGTAYPPSQGVFATVGDAPEWATFHTLRIGYVEFPIASLRKVRRLAVSGGLFRNLIRATEPLRVTHLDVPVDCSRSLAYELTETSALSELRGLAVGPTRPWTAGAPLDERLVALLDVPLVRRLDTLDLTTNGGGEVARTVALVAARLPAIRTLGLDETGWRDQGYKLVFTRSDGAGEFDACRVTLGPEPRDRALRDRDPGQWLDGIFAELPDALRPAPDDEPE